tara:strand:- start:121 stop:852 length:732 start_codon:yes stop_codon:yes gene_type:complete
MGNTICKSNSIQIKESKLNEYQNIITTYENNYNTLKNAFRCMICMENIMNLSPTCGHMGICLQCYNLPRLGAYRRKCIICKNIIKYNKIIFPFTIEEQKINNFYNLNIENTIDTILINEESLHINSNIIQNFNSMKESLNSDIDRIEKKHDRLKKNNSILVQENIELEKNKNEMNENIKKLEFESLTIEDEINELININKKLKEENQIISYINSNKNNDMILSDYEDEINSINSSNSIIECAN